MKRQYLLFSLANAIVELKSDSGFRPLLAALEFEAQFDEKQLIENHSYMCRRTRRLQVGKTLSGIGPVHFKQRFPRRHQAQMRAHRRRDWIGDWIAKTGIQIFQRPADNPPKPARRKFALPGRFVDRNNPSNLKRGSRLFFSLVGSALFVNVAQNLELRLHDLQFAVAPLLDLAIKRQHLSGLKAVLKIRGIKPDTLQPGAALAHRELEDGRAARAKQSRVAD